MASRRVSNNAPQVKVTFPNGGEMLQGQTQTVTWQASDADGSHLTYSLLYSTDAGQSWQPIDTNIKEFSYTLKLEELPGSNTALVRVIATDGVNTSLDDSNSTFRVPVKAPQARISSPANQSIFSTTQTIVLIGEANDLEDSLLEGDMLQWCSDRQGMLGSGRSLSVTGLTPGTHKITLTAKDRSEAEAEAFILVQVTPVIPTIVFSGNSGIACPSNITVTAQVGQSSVVVNYPLADFSNQGGAVVLASPPPGSAFPIGTTTVTITAATASGVFSCKFTVRVNPAP